MDLLIIFFLMGLVLQGIKIVVKHALSGAEDFNNTAQPTNEVDYSKLVAIPVSENSEQTALVPAKQQRAINPPESEAANFRKSA